MRLAIPSLLIFIYIVVSLIAFVPWGPLAKVVGTLVLLAISQKYLIYENIGGSFIAPILPRSLLLSMEVLYSSMFILAFLLLIKDSLALLLWLGSSWRLPFSPGTRSGGLVLVSLVLGIYGTWLSIRVPDVRTIEITLPRLPTDLNGFSIVQLSDLHIGPFLNAHWLRRVVEKANSMAPDLVALTGDMIDGYPDELQDDIAPLGDLRARHGIYGITGNHEYYFRVEKWLQVFEKLGINMLHNDHVILSSAGGSKLVIAGVPDQTELRYGGSGPDIAAALKDAPETITVLLAHRPKQERKAGGVIGGGAKISADLQLSGHTHGGHLFFLQWLIGMFNKGLVNGLYDVDDMKLYVSPGTGLWAGFSCRLGVPSEITHIILRTQKRE